MAKVTKVVRLTEDEIAAIAAYRNTVKAGQEAKTEPKVEKVEPTAAQQALADALVQAIERTRPPQKKTIADRKENTPWTPKDGSPQLKLKRKMYHHGMMITGKISNEEIELLNKVRPGHYCDGVVRVTARRDRGVDIDYPIATAQQRLRLINAYKITSFADLLRRIVDENANPRKYRKADDPDVYDLDEQ